MSALGDRLRDESASSEGLEDFAAFWRCAKLADEYETAVLAEATQLRGPFAAAVLRALAARQTVPHHGLTAGIGIFPRELLQMADEAEQ